MLKEFIRHSSSSKANPASLAQLSISFSKSLLAPSDSNLNCDYCFD